MWALTHWHAHIASELSPCQCSSECFQQPRVPSCPSRLSGVKSHSQVTHMAVLRAPYLRMDRRTDSGGQEAASRVLPRADLGPWSCQDTWLEVLGGESQKNSAGGPGLRKHPGGLPTVEGRAGAGPGAVLQAAPAVPALTARPCPHPPQSRCIVRGLHRSCLQKGKHLASES